MCSIICIAVVVCVITTIIYLFKYKLTFGKSTLRSGLVDCQWLHKHMKDENVKILDATYVMKPKRDWKDFQKRKYGQFDQLIEKNPEPEYEKGHIPEAVHFNFEAAYYPSEYEKAALYPPEIFQTYIRLLNVLSDDHIVIYSRGPCNGMLFAARVWWTFKVYGHENVSVLDGGFEKWTKLGYPVNDLVPDSKPGNWTAKPLNKNLVISFEELNNERKQPSGSPTFEKCHEINFIDVRPADLFNGDAPLGVEAKDATGSHVKGAKNIPNGLLLSEGVLKKKEEIEKVLTSSGFDKNKSTVVMCNGGVGASLFALALNECQIPSRVYNGSMFELASRASHLINGGKKYQKV